VLIGGEPESENPLDAPAFGMDGEYRPNNPVLLRRGKREQIQMRSERLKISSENIWLLCTNVTEQIISSIHDSAPEYGVVDSILSISNPSLVPSRGVTSFGKAATDDQKLPIRKYPNLLVGHVIKKNLAVPRIIENMVDTVCIRRRTEKKPVYGYCGSEKPLGSTNEIGLFEMAIWGLNEVRILPTLSPARRDYRLALPRLRP
jgi:DNA repair protein RadA/Sms